MQSSGYFKGNNSEGVSANLSFPLVPLGIRCGETGSEKKWVKVRRSDIFIVCLLCPGYSLRSVCSCLLGFLRILLEPYDKPATAISTYAWRYLGSPSTCAVWVTLSPNSVYFDFHSASAPDFFVCLTAKNIALIVTLPFTHITVMTQE